MRNQRLTFTWTDEQIAQLVKRAKKAGISGESDRELIYRYFCQRERLEPVKHGGRREEAIAGTIAYMAKKSQKKEGSVSRLQTAIARLKREIAALEAKPAPQRSNYSEARVYNRAVTARRNAIAQRRNLIAEYEARLIG